MGQERVRTQEVILGLLLLAGCSSGLDISYHRVALGAADRSLMVLVSKDKDLGDDNEVALLDRLMKRPAEKLHFVVGRIGDRSFASIDSGSGPLVVTDHSAHVPAELRELDDILRARLEPEGTYSRKDDRGDISAAREILGAILRR